MDFFILVIGHARIAYEGNVKVAPFTELYGERQTENNFRNFSKSGK